MIDDGFVAAVENTQFIGLGNFRAKTSATGAQNTAFLVQNNMGANDGSFFRLVFVFEKTAVVFAYFHVIVLEVTFAGLVTNRAI